jgi:hypothetical protein
MKKVLCIAIVALLAASVGYAAEGDEPGNIGVGYQGVVLGDLLNGVAVRGTPAPIGWQVELVQGMAEIDPGGGTLEVDALVLKGKGYYALIERANSAFYVGASLGYWTAEICSPGPEADIDGWSIAPLMGAEWNFAELPELGINFEVSYEFDMLEDDAGGTTDIDLYGITVSTGVTYYF